MLCLNGILPGSWTLKSRVFTHVATSPVALIVDFFAVLVSYLIAHCFYHIFCGFYYYYEFH